MWLICLPEFRGRRRVQWQPRRLTELYFLDEATGLAAGHRPCGECRNRDYRAFKAAWLVARPEDRATVADIDARLHADRLRARGVRRTWRDVSGRLPDGAMVRHEATAHLVLGKRLRTWTPAGHADSIPYEPDQELAVLTPRCTVATLLAGYRPVLHPTA